MDEWTEVLFTYDEVEAHIVKDVLESEGIQAVIKSLKVRPYPVSIGRMGEVRVLVRAGDAEKAKGLLEIIKETYGKESNDC